MFKHLVFASILILTCSSEELQLEPGRYIIRSVQDGTVLTVPNEGLIVACESFAQLPTQYWNVQRHPGGSGYLFTNEVNHRNDISGPPDVPKSLRPEIQDPTSGTVTLVLRNRWCLLKYEAE